MVKWNNGGWLRNFSATRAATHLLNDPHWPASSRQRLQSLTREKDPQLFWQGLLWLGKDLSGKGEQATAARIYRTILDQHPLQPAPQPFLKTAKTELALLEGQGPVGKRFEFLLGDFIQQAVAPAPLIGMGLAQGASVLARGILLRNLLSASANVFTRGVGAKTLAALAGISAETTTFTLGTRVTAQLLGHPKNFPEPTLAEEITGNAWMFGAMQVTGAIVAGAGKIRGMNSSGMARWTQALLPQAANVGGILLGRKLASPDGASQLLEGLVTWLQVQVAGHFTHGLFKNTESRLIWDYRRPFPQFFQTSGGNTPLPAIPKGISTPATPSIFLQPILSSSNRPGEPKGAQEIVRKYRYLFPEPTHQTYTNSIIELALATPSDLPEFHDRLLQAYATANNAGSQDQLLVAEMIEKAFRYQAAHSSTGTFQHAILQDLTERLIREENPMRRNGGLHRAFKFLEKGGSAFALLPVFQKYGLLQSFEENFPPSDTEHSANSWSALRRKYPDMERALNFSLLHPLGPLARRRMTHVLNSGDLPDKFKEISLTALSPDTLGTVRSMLLKNRSLPDIAAALNGTAHTGFLHDIRLARKVASVMAEAHLVFNEPENSRKRRPPRLELAIKSFLYSRQPLSPPNLVRLLETNPSDQVQALRQNWEEGQFQIKILPGTELDRIVAEWGQVQDCQTALFIRTREGDQILIRALPRLDLNNPHVYFKATQEIETRLLGLIHEWEHWRHFSEKDAIPLRGINRKERLVSEVMAHFEELRWRLRNVHPPLPRITHALGLTPAQFYRAHNEWQYFGKKITSGLDKGLF